MIANGIKHTKKFSIGSIGGGGYSHIRVILALVKLIIRRFTGLGSPTEIYYDDVVSSFV